VYFLINKVYFLCDLVASYNLEVSVSNSLGWDVCVANVTVF